MRINRHQPKEKQEKKEQTEITKHNILALDIAVHTGFFHPLKGGTWNFEESRARNNNKQHKDFRDTLMTFIVDYDIKQIVAEDVNVSTHFASVRKLSEFRGILLEVCDELGLPEPEFVPVPTLKKYATNNGKASKEEMIEACIRRYNITPFDDNHADACHLYFYYLRKHKIPWVTEEASNEK